MSTGLTTFGTAIGVCGIAWRGERVIATNLPEATCAALEQRLVSRSGGAVRGAPPAAVQRAIEAIAALLGGAAVDLGFIACDYGSAEPFKVRIYEATRAILPGETATYGEIAERLGNKSFAQAVGQAMGSNLLPIVVPCHRVMGADGKLTGFSAHGGVALKVRLLEIERSAAGRGTGLFADLPLAAKATADQAGGSAD